MLFDKINELLNQVNKVSVRLDQIAHSANRAKNASWYSLSENEIVTSLYTGQFIVVDRRDLSVSPSLILTGEWELQLGQIFRTWIKPGDVVFDIGANVGYFGLIAATQNLDGKIHFFEANPYLTELIQKTCQLNAISNRSNVVNHAIGRDSGEILSFQQPKNLWGSTSCHPSIFGTNIEIEKEFSIESVTIDDYCESQKNYKCDVVKIDVEGFEEEVLYGMEKTLKTNPTMRVLMEYTPGAYSDQFFSFLNRWFPKKGIFIENRGVVDINNEKELTLLNKSNDWCTLILSRE